MGMRQIGAKVQRLEDPRLLTGHGRYIDDMRLPGMLHATFVRSGEAHARIRSIDAEAARALPGVHAIYTLADLGGAGSTKRMGQLYPSPFIKQDITQYALAKDEVNFVGQTVAVVVADSRAIAEDAAAMVFVDYEPLTPVVDVRAAAKAGAPVAHAGTPDNVAAVMRNKWGDVDAAFAAAHKVLTIGFMQHRGGCHSMETRGCIASHDPFGDGLTLWSGTQAPYLVRRALASFLETSEAEVRVVAPDVGGGFGPKAGFYAEEAVVAVCAMKLGRPVKWIEDRREHFYSTTTQRDQWWDLEIAIDADGVVTGLKGHVTHENGAFIPYGLLLCNTTLGPLPGPYRIRNVDVGLTAIFTNTTPNTPIRGAGRPNAAYAMERVMEAVARATGLSPVEVRRRNLVRAEEFPYATGAKNPAGIEIRYDSGDYHALLDKALARAGWADFAARQAEARRQGRYIGVGVSCCIEDTGIGPYEGATVRVEPNGRVLLQTGAASQGQGHRTVFSQIVADTLGVDLDKIVYESADTGKFPQGVGTVASRVTSMAGTAIYTAASQVREKALKLAAQILEVSEGDLEIESGIVRVKGSDLKVSLGDLAKRLTPMSGGMLPKGFTPSLDATSYEAPKGMPFASGCNVAEVEVDIGTGEVKLTRYVVAHDCGVMLNPMLVDGQIVGGVVHGIGNALYEHALYDDRGQPLATNYGEYLMALATEMPRIEVIHQETPSPTNPLGVKGAGEGGTIPAIAAVVAAIEDALKPFGAVIEKYPVSPEYITQLVDAGLPQAAE